MFCGRIPEIEAIDHCLKQTKAGNPQHFLIEGERGIGKSSLLFLQSLVASGRLNTMDDQKVKFLILNVILEQGDNYFVIVKKISTELHRQIRKRDRLKDIGLKAWDLISRIEAGGIKIRDPKSNVDQHELLSNLQDDFEIIINNLEDDDGVLLLFDEADQPGSEGHLGRLCKLLTEHLTRVGCEKLCIGLAGLPGLISTLRDSHESSPRLFMTMDLRPLEGAECEQVIDMGMREAENNNVKVSITDDAKKLIAKYSEGYPHFLQEFSYYSYESDNNNIIDRDDILSSLFGENGVFDQLGRKYFTQYYNAPYSDNYRKVLDTMSEHSDEWVDRRTIIDESHLKEGIVDNALRALKGRNIIIQNEQRRGEYRLPTRSFAVWIKAREMAEKNLLEGGDNLNLFKD